jgi:hypothetical protein
MTHHAEPASHTTGSRHGSRPRRRVYGDAVAATNRTTTAHSIMHWLLESAFRSFVISNFFIFLIFASISIERDRSAS